MTNTIAIIQRWMLKVCNCQSLKKNPIVGSRRQGFMSAMGPRYGGEQSLTLKRWVGNHRGGPSWVSINWESKREVMLSVISIAI